MNYDINLLFLLTCLGFGLGTMTSIFLRFTSRYLRKMGNYKLLCVGFTSVTNPYAPEDAWVTFSPNTNLLTTSVV